MAKIFQLVYNQWDSLIICLLLEVGQIFNHFLVLANLAFNFIACLIEAFLFSLGFFRVFVFVVHVLNRESEIGLLLRECFKIIFFVAH
jgi:hypothetical protein